MIDAEWDSWQSTWTGATGPLPDVRARARKEVRLHRRAKAIFFLLVAVALVAGGSATFADRSAAVRAIGWINTAFLVAMSVGYLLIQRGIGLQRTGNPREALAFLERRLRVERLVAHLVRWSYAFLCAAFVVVFPKVVQGHEAPRLEMSIAFPWMFVVLLVTFSAPWWVARRSRRHQEEIDRWRQWMDDQRL
jgi:threonine/homoserine/homoserine lactone efflux protein